MEKRELTCIGCPMGCALTASLEAGKVVSVEGYTCKRGRDYGEKECTNPMRTVTSSVPVTGGAIAMVSVKTASDIPKGKIQAWKPFTLPQSRPRFTSGMSSLQT